MNGAGGPKVSVVVPVYNVERYLAECVDSILRQTLKDIEVILVDDGSPDGCGRMIDDYARRDARVVPVHQPNRGYGAAVNRGIAMARGAYVGIVESDDWIEPDMYEKLYASALANDTDVTKGGFFVYRSAAADPRERDVVFRNTDEVDLWRAPEGAFRITDWPALLAFHPSIWSSIYRADFIKAIGIPETAGASYQDFPFIMQVLTRARRISVVKQCFVHWRNDPQQGNSTSAGGRKLLVMPQSTLAARKIIEESGLYEALKEPFFVHASWANYEFFNRIEMRYKKEYFDLMREVLRPIKGDKTFRYQYFSPIDRRFVDGILYGSWPMLRLRLGLGALRRRLRG